MYEASSFFVSVCSHILIPVSAVLRRLICSSFCPSISVVSSTCSPIRTRISDSRCVVRSSFVHSFVRHLLTLSFSSQAYAALAELLREITQSISVELGPMVMILVKHCESRDNFTRLTVLTWMFEFIQLGKAKLLPFCAEMLGAALQCISDPEKEIRQKSEKTNEVLLRLVEDTESKLDIAPLLTKVCVLVLLIDGAIALFCC